MSDAKKRMYFIEVTICFETGFDEAAERKKRHYTDLEEEAQRRGYYAQALPVQIGSRGFIIDNSLESLQDCLKHISHELGRLSRLIL